MFDVLEDLLANKPWLVSLFYRVRKRTVEITNIFIEFLSSATPLRVDFLQQPPFQGGPETFPRYLSNPSLFNSDDLKKVFFKYKWVYKFFSFFFSFIISKQVCLRKINYFIIFQPRKKVFNSEISSFNFVFF